jgi:hypothetical protein
MCQDSTAVTLRTLHKRYRTHDFIVQADTIARCDGAQFPISMQ